MAGTIDPTDIAKARGAGYSDAEIVGFLSDKQPDQFKQAKDAGYSDKDILDHLDGTSTAPSGVAAGFAHGAEETRDADMATAKNFYGVGSGGNTTDPNYVPANVFNGSANPLNWNYSQIPQKAAEMAPGMAQDIAAAGVGAKAGKAIGGVRGAAIGGFVGGAGSIWHRIAGNDAQADATSRTGDPNATPEGQDLARAGLSDAPAAAIGAINPLRYIPGANRVTSVGLQGVSDAAKKYLTTAAVGGGASAASDAVSQLGNTGTIDPARSGEAFAGGAGAGLAMASPRAAADMARAAYLRDFGGVNRPATEAVTNRLVDASGDKGLGATIGGSKNDFTSLETVKSDLKNELGDAARSVRKSTTLSPDADNALQRAQTGKPVTPDDVDLIQRETAGTPDGDNVAFLARQAHMLQRMQEKGSYDPSHNKWAGGISGVLDKNLGFILNPTRMVAGTLATGLGMHLLGTSNPMFAAAAAGGYGGSRVIDALTGMRSPAKMFEDTFANQNQPTRLPQTPAPSAPTPPSVPNVPPPAPSPWGYAQPQAPQPQVNANAMNQQVVGALRMAAARRKMAAQAQQAQQTNMTQQAQPLLQQLAATRPQPAPPAPAPVDPLNLPRDITAPGANVIKGLMLRQKLMQANAPAPAPEPTPAPQPAPAPPQPAPIDPTALPAEITKPAKTLMSSLAKVQAMKTAATAPPAAAKITKSNGKVNDSGNPADPYAKHEANPFYEPVPQAQQYKNGMDVDQIAQHEANRTGIPGARRVKYMNSVRGTTSERIQRIQDIAMDASPVETGTLRELERQLLHVNSADAGMRAIVHARGALSPETYGRVKRSFSPDVMARVFNNK